jgi:hypothetical protein
LRRVVKWKLPTRDATRAEHSSKLDCEIKVLLDSITESLAKIKSDYCDFRDPTLVALAELDHKIRDLCDFQSYDLPSGFSLYVFSIYNPCDQALIS